eukprot:1897567-Pleurochrysis_carterae.AAC.5
MARVAITRARDTRTQWRSQRGHCEQTSEKFSPPTTPLGGTDAPRRSLGVASGQSARQALRASKRADPWLCLEPARIEDLGAGRKWAPSANSFGAPTHSPRKVASDQPAARAYHRPRICFWSMARS